MSFTGGETRLVSLSSDSYLELILSIGLMSLFK